MSTKNFAEIIKRAITEQQELAKSDEKSMKFSVCSVISFCSVITLLSKIEFQRDLDKPRRIS